MSRAWRLSKSATEHGMPWAAVLDQLTGTSAMNGAQFART
jgi:hypothetical protein